MALNAEAKHVKNPKRFVGKEGKIETGSMPNVGEFTAELAPKDSADASTKSSTTLGWGYHNGKGKLTIQPLTTSTRDTNATSSDIFKNKTALVKGSVVTGVASVSDVSSFAYTGATDTTLGFSWTNPSGGLFNGVHIVYKAGGSPSGPDDGTVVRTTGTTTAAGTTSVATISGLSNDTTYYARIYSYAYVNGTEELGEYTAVQSGTTTCSGKCYTCSDWCYTCANADGANWITAVCFSCYSCPCQGPTG